MASADEGPGDEYPTGVLARLHARWTQYTRVWEPFAIGARLILKDLWRSFRDGNRLALFRQHETRERAFAEWFKMLSHHFARHEATSAVPALVGSAHGVVLELGPGTGNQLGYFDASAVARAFGVEPNRALADALVARLAAADGGGAGAALRDKYTPLCCGVEDRAALERAGVVPGGVDCVLSVQVLCSVERPGEVARWLYELLRPGGEVIFWEHCRSEDAATRCVQWLWSLVWPVVVGGCRLDRPIQEILLGAGEWEAADIETNAAPHLVMPRVWGRLRKAKARDA